MNLLFVLLAGVAQPAAAAPPPPQPVQRVVRHAPPPPVVIGTAVVLPLEFTAGIPTITATAGGRPLKLGFDTGAPGPAHLYETTTAALALEKVGEARMSDPSGRNAKTIPMYALPQLTLGSLEIRNWIATGTPLVPEKLKSLDGIIGLGAFNGYVVTIDYPGRQLRIEKGALPAADGRRVFEYKNDPIPLLPLTIEGRTINAHLDTGNLAGALIVPEAFAAQLSRHAEAKHMGQARTVSNVMEIKGFEVEGAVRVGDVPLDVQSVTFPSIIDLANIGSGALGGVIVRIDPANGRIALDRSPPLT